MKLSLDRRQLTRGGADRRQHTRFTLPAGYTPILVRTLDREDFHIEGYAYDLSEGGVRFELDQPVAPGTAIAMQIMLPGLAHATTGPGRAVFVFANVVWLEDEDEPGPVKMAAVFSRFARAEDLARLRGQLMGRRYRAAA
jgi:hypothetical protein